MTQEWMADEGRAPWVTNSLRHRSGELRAAAKRCRAAYRKDYMGVPASWLADAYDAAAKVLDDKLDEINACKAT